MKKIILRGKPMMSMIMTVLVLFCALLLLMLVLMFPEVIPVRYQLIARLDCPDGEFVIDVRPYNPSLAGTAFLDIRYRYRGVVLTGISYNGYDKYLLKYLHQVDPELREQITRSGFTLYFPPEQFGADEVARVAACINANQWELEKASYKNIFGKFSFGLVSTRTELSHYKPHEIDLIICANSPIADLYSDDYLTIIIEREGAVILLIEPAGTKVPAEAFSWGKVLPPRFGFGRPRLELNPVIFNGETYDSQFAKLLGRHTYGLNRRTINQNYKVVPPVSTDR
ncbi:hypothetical protein [Cephaloticoccus capnophilus]|nr:hypothetical protein [Cephaloticoccus capnophilus]